MPRRDGGHSSPGPSSTAVGDLFEDQVAAAFGLVPGVRVGRRVRLGGKAVDAVLYQQGFLGGRETVIAVECKDYRRRLTREQVSSVLADYWPLLQGKNVDQVLIVTRNGLVENAVAALDDNQTRHLLYADIVNFVLDRNKLAHEMVAQYGGDDLSLYYQPADATCVDVKLALKHYDLYFSEFVEFELSRSLPPLSLERWADAEQRAAATLLKQNALEWDSRYPDDPPFHQGQLFPRLNYEILFDRRRQEHADLLDLVNQWLATESSVQLALLGTYGTGKSSFARHLAWWTAQQFLSGVMDRAPILIELRRFSADQDIESLITNELANRNGIEGATYTRFQALNRDGHFVLILDGFDEMKHGMSREALTHNFNEINRLSVGRAKVFIVGRPTIFADSSEQAEFMRSGADSALDRRVQYLPLHIAPLSVEKSLALFTRYSDYSVEGRDGTIESMAIEAALRGIQQSAELQELLARPVHIPMLLRVLPGLPASDIAKLQRSRLYLEFIRRTILREISRGREVSQRSLLERIDFAARLACEMMRQGNSRAISVSAIPDSLIDQYVLAGQSRDTTRRELISACFLEFKPPDILFFGHKSYCEFLAGLHLHQTYEAGEPLTAGLQEIMNSEAVEFFLGLCEGSDIETMTSDIEQYFQFLELISWARVDARRERQKQLVVFRRVLGEVGCSQLRIGARNADWRALIAFANIYGNRPPDVATREAWLLVDAFREHPQIEVSRAAIEALSRSRDRTLFDQDA